MKEFKNIQNKGSPVVSMDAVGKDAHFSNKFWRKKNDISIFSSHKQGLSMKYHLFQKNFKFLGWWNRKSEKNKILELEWPKPNYIHIYANN